MSGGTLISLPYTYAIFLLAFVDLTPITEKRQETPLTSSMTATGRGPHTRFSEHAVNFQKLVRTKLMALS
jgi:hypothetical protein